jgi:hypothetical protein
MKKTTFLLSILALVFFQACKDNPVGDDDHNHKEAVGLVLTSSGVELVRYEAPNTPTGEIIIPAGSETDLITVNFIAEDNDLFQPDEPEYTLGQTIADETIAEFEQHEEDGKWRFHIKGLQAGTTTITLNILHNDHSDFTSQPITIVVE